MYGVQHKPTPTGGAAAAWGSASLRNPPFAGAYFMFSFVASSPRPVLLCSPCLTRGRVGAGVQMKGMNAPLACLSLVAACLAMLWAFRPSRDGICDFDVYRLRCTPKALCELQWEGWTCTQRTPQLPRHHPPVSRAQVAAGTFCGLALDDDGYIILRGFREWGMYEWGLAVGIVNWSVVILVSIYDRCGSSSDSDGISSKESSPGDQAVIAHDDHPRTTLSESLAVGRSTSPSGRAESPVNGCLASRSRRLQSGLATPHKVESR